MKKTAKKPNIKGTIIDKVVKGEMTLEEASICMKPTKEQIAETSTDFGGQGLVDLANKVNEIIRYLNK